MTTKNLAVTEPQNDAELWQHFKNGCEKSFTTLHQRYYNELYFYSLKIAGDEALAKNAIQELFIYLWRSKAHLTDVLQIKKYLLFSVRRHVLRLMQKENKSVALFSILDNSLNFTFSQEDVLITKETEEINKERVVQALNQLTGRQREVVYLRYFNELSTEEIADVTGLNYQSVLNCMGRALLNLRKIMLTKNVKEISIISLLVLLIYLLFHF